MPAKTLKVKTKKPIVSSSFTDRKAGKGEELRTKFKKERMKMLFEKGQNKKYGK